MGLLLEAAKQWNKLNTTNYRIVVGHRKNLKSINLIFRDADFDHLSGIHYAKDIDFKLHYKEYRGSKLISALRSQKLDDSLIEKSINWERISDRLYAILHLCEILESGFTIYNFSPRKLPFYSDISASHLIYNERYKNGIFLFLDHTDELYYCKSIFGKDARNYTLNQTRATVLQIKKGTNGIEKIIYTHPNYKTNDFEN